MKSLAYTKADMKKKNQPSKGLACDPGMGNKYPYGLSLTLNDESLKKLGLGKLPEVGDKMTITCEVEVSSVRASKRVGEKDDRSVELQVCGMDLGDEADLEGATGDEDFVDSVVKATKRDLGRG